MDWQNVGLGVAGIVISIITFAIGYRQTLGARQARAVAADSAVVETILRRIVLEEVMLTADEFEKIIYGKAAEQSLPRTALRPVDQVADVLYSRILESDLISRADRVRSLATVSEIRKGMTTARNLQDAEDRKRSRRANAPFAAGVVGLAVIAGIVGSLAIGLLVTKTEGGPPGDPLTGLALPLFATITIPLLIGVVLILLRVSRRANQRSSSSFASPTVRELTTYPSEAEGQPALARLSELSPFACRNLFQLAEDEVTSLQHGWEIGMPASPDVTLGLRELIDRHLVEEVPEKLDRKTNQSWYILTPTGRQLARLLLVTVVKHSVKPPGYLQAYLGQQDLIEAAAQPSNGSVNTSPPKTHSSTLGE